MKRVVRKEWGNKDVKRGQETTKAHDETFRKGTICAQKQTQNMTRQKMLKRENVKMLKK